MAAALLKFDPARRRVHARRETPSDTAQGQRGTAQILLFTGVRVERAPEPEGDDEQPHQAS